MLQSLLGIVIVAIASFRDIEFDFDKMDYMLKNLVKKLGDPTVYQS